MCTMRCVSGSQGCQLVRLSALWGKMKKTPKKWCPSYIFSQNVKKTTLLFICINKMYVIMAKEKSKFFYFIPCDIPTTLHDLWQGACGRCNWDTLAHGMVSSIFGLLWASLETGSNKKHKILGEIISLLNQNNGLVGLCYLKLSFGDFIQLDWGSERCNKQSYLQVDFFHLGSPSCCSLVWTPQGHMWKSRLCGCRNQKKITAWKKWKKIIPLRKLMWKM